MEQVLALAKAVGIPQKWEDAAGVEQTVEIQSIAAVLTALGYPAGSEADARQSLDRIEAEKRQPPKMIVADAGKPIPLPPSLHPTAELAAEDGTTRTIAIENYTLPPIHEPGYYQLALGGHEVILAVAPETCHPIRTFGDRAFWGPAIQIHSLRGRKLQPFGHFGHLNNAVKQFAARGADAVMINPVHALYPHYSVDFSPYSPSSRIFLNGLMADPSLLSLPPLPASTETGFIDWGAAIPQRLAELRAIFDRLDRPTRARIASDCEAGGDNLRRHAIFDALDMHFGGDSPDGWKKWPQAYHDPDGPAVRRFVAENPDAIDFQLFLQWLAKEGLAEVQKTAKASGMAIGLIADLAVGVRPGGSDAWSLRDQMLDGLTVGAPPDLLGPLGQNWLVTSYSPHGLIDSGFAPWIAMLRAALSRAGGIRIDHAFGLSRLWVVPDGAESRDGAYLNYPFQDMVRLAMLESHRARALIVPEDLGTAPTGFAEAIDNKEMLGMRVLWFERAEDGGYIGPRDYDPLSVAMTGTHDLPTVAGWWKGNDLKWADKLGRLPKGSTRETEEEKRAWDRGLLWSTFGGTEPRPEPDKPEPVVEAALQHLGSTASRLAIAPIEDLLALVEQPNLPGTITEHPNWRRRLPGPLDELLDEPDTKARVQTLAEARIKVPPPGE
ncbi:MAG: 4-alpha-glucanotransferase [Hyphomicrobiaceae bacterium]|nr:4-alpha-glucanotransferase [Hyphomicrobiaceae bacterium]MCC0025109.1 4-alpha-glucanotransferase [Hyphomicrobiaceae bacterium]